MLKLTHRQQQILDVIKQNLQLTGFPPTRVEIAQHFGFRSANAAEEHLKALAKKGAIELLAGTSRGIRLLGDHQHDPDETLPLVGKVAAGQPILAAEHVEQRIQVNPGVFRSKPDFLLRVEGLSMQDIGILDGDLLAVRQAQTALNGQIVVARIEEDVTVKRFEKTGKQILLHPENKDFDVIKVSPKTAFAIEGIAIGVIRDFS
ncbi:transcriptional repressor LexA [Pelagibaculum spongiae]|uniref:LexA repressor n=1 Tax=Pelagibaculum spongiae TaxID=2080658 RepID=A0A2V1GWV9_9GAMM|nr:transcriptional repressor LexA [Pelagibaculum spongiae]PVZ69548.1 repressor LexA [Pelagibaculum spongiae]